MKICPVGVRTEGNRRRDGLKERKGVRETENGDRDGEGRAGEESGSWKTGIRGVSGLTPDFLLSSEPVVNGCRSQHHMSEAVDIMAVSPFYFVLLYVCFFSEISVILCLFGGFFNPGLMVN